MIRFAPVKVHFGKFPPNRPKNPVVTTGTFDGVHLGHQQIIDRLIRSAKENQGESVVVTFDPHPRSVLFPNDLSLKLLQSVEEKAERLSALGVDHLLVIPFDKAFAEMSADDYIRKIIVDLIGASKLVIGYDHQFGKNREGSFLKLKQMAMIYGFEVEEIPARIIDQVTISSSRIRKALTAGDLETANAFLGYPYTLSGKVVHGNALGRTIGFPTANIEISHPLKLIPASGVYIVNVSVNELAYQAMMNIGYRPTMHVEHELTLEVHLLGFSGDLYGQHLRVSCFKRLRDEKKFDDIAALKNQLLLDKKQVEDFFKV
jgi:riboflavin kinase/FMN adenylyltransferase